MVGTSSRFTAIPRKLALEVARPWTWLTGVNIPSPYAAFYCCLCYAIHVMTRASHVTGTCVYCGAWAGQWGCWAGVVMSLLSAGNSWSTCQSRANPSPPLKWGYRDRDMTRITWSVLRQRNMLAIGLHSANIWNLSSIQPVLNCNFILTLHALQQTQRHELDFSILCNLKVKCLRILFYCLHSLPSHTTL